MTRLRRFLKITWILCKYRLDEFLPHTQIPLALRILLILAPWHLIPRSQRPRGERLRLALIELGPIFVKFGQILSTRRDLLPLDVADELKHLQDRVPPFSSELARLRIEQSLARPIEQVFSEFDNAPLASASIAQVHAARLHTGEDVVVKLIRPGIRPIIRQDIALLFLFARLLERFWADGKRLHPVEIVADEGVYDYSARYTAGRPEFFAPARLRPEVADACARLAVTAHTALGLRDISRTDIIVDGEGEPYFLEVNVAPGMTETSLFPMAAAAAGEDLGALCRGLLLAALRRR